MVFFFFFTACYVLWNGFWLRVIEAFVLVNLHCYQWGIINHLFRKTQHFLYYMSFILCLFSLYFILFYCTVYPHSILFCVLKIHFIFCFLLIESKFYLIHPLLPQFPLHPLLPTPSSTSILHQIYTPSICSTEKSRSPSNYNQTGQNKIQ